MGKTAIELSGFAREPKLSTLLGGLRSRATCGNELPHSGSRWFHGKDGVGGSIPPGGSTTALTSGSSATACASGAGEVAATASALGGCSAGVASVQLRSRRSVVRDPAMSLPPRSGDPAAPPRTAISAGERHRYRRSQTYRNGWAGLTVPLGSARAHRARYSRAREETGPRFTAQEAAWSMLQTIPGVHQ